MKLDDIALSNVLRAYGSELKGIRTGKKSIKPDISTNIDNLSPEKMEELKVARYDQNGQVKENSDKKQQLIDFFE